MKGVIFDLDGLMIDSERIICQALKRAGSDMGLDNVEEPILRCIGLNKISTEAIFREFYGADFDFVRFYELKAEYISQITGSRGFPPKKGVLELLDYLSAEKIPHAVCSSSRLGYVRESLEKIGALGYFDTFVCGDMGLKGKPEPDMFLRCAELMELQPPECYVLEDSRNGITAAYRAGMKPIMIPDLIAPDDELRAMLYALKSDLTEVIGLLQQDGGD